MDENKSLRVRVFVCVCVCFLCVYERGGLAITTTKGPEMSRRNVSGGNVRDIAKSEREKECEH